MVIAWSEDRLVKYVAQYKREARLVYLLQSVPLQPDVVLTAAAARHHQATHLVTCNWNWPSDSGLLTISPYKSNCSSGLGPQTIFS